MNSISNMIMNGIAAVTLAVAIPSAAASGMMQFSQEVPGLPLGEIPTELIDSENPKALVDLRPFFSERGLRFPKGTNAYFVPMSGMIVVMLYKNDYPLATEIIRDAYPSSLFESQARSWIKLTEKKSREEMIEMARRAGYLFDPIICGCLREYDSLLNLRDSGSADLKYVNRKVKLLKARLAADLVRSRKFLAARYRP